MPLQNTRSELTTAPDEGDRVEITRNGVATYWQSWSNFKTYSNNLGNSDLTVSSSGTRSFSFGGNTIADKFVFQKQDGTSVAEFKGDGNVNFGNIFFNGTSIFLGQSGANNFIQLNGTNNRVFSLNNQFQFVTGSAAFNVTTIGGNLRYRSGNVQLGNVESITHSATNSILLENGVEPTSGVVGRTFYYSKDTDNGTNTVSSPTWKQGDGNEMRLYRQTLSANPTGAEIRTFLDNLGLVL